MIQKIKPTPLKIKAEQLQQIFGDLAKITLKADKIIIELDKVNLKLEK